MFLNLYSLKCLTKQKQNMKKSVLALAMAFGVTGAFAQDLTSKKGEPYLPEAGDWSIGIQADPFFQYTKSLIGAGAGATSPSVLFLNPNNMIVGKMFKDEKTAYRAGIRIGLNTNKYNKAVDKFEKDPSSTSTAPFQEAATPSVDKAKVTDRWIGLSAGIEMRRGKTRLQGFYGGELAIWGGSKKEAYKYANDLTQGTTANLDAGGGVTGTDAAFYSGNYTTDFAATTGLSSNVIAANSIPNYAVTDASRVLKRKTNGSMGIGVRGFIGAEYFIFPKISIGGEFGWGLGYQSNGKNKYTIDAEGTDASSGTQSAKEIKTKDAVKSGSFVGLDTDNKNSLIGPSAAIRLNLHF